MNTDQFYIGAYWGSRREDLACCARRLHECLSQLTHCDEVFGRWFKLGYSKKQALAHEVGCGVGQLESVLCRVPVGDRGTATYKDTLYYSFGLWNGRDDEGVCSLSGACGGFPPGSSQVNSFVLHLPSNGAPGNRVVQRDRVWELLIAIVQAWEPDWAVVSSDYVRNIRRAGSREPDCAWMYFLSARRGGVTRLSPPAHSRPLGQHGTIVVAMNHRPDATDEDDILLLKQTYDSLHKAGLCAPIPL